MRTRAARLEVNRLEDRVVPTATVTASAYANAVWGGTNGEAIFTRTGPDTAALTVSYTVGGSAVSGRDYTALSGTATFAPGSATADANVVALLNSTNGADVLLTLANGSGYTVGTPASADITLIDYPDVVTAYGGTATTTEYGQTTVPVLNLSSDTTGSTLTVSSVTQGADGSVVNNGNGTVTYTPNANFSGTDSFTYTVKDQYGNTSTGTVSVLVTAPLAASAETWTAANTAVTVTVLNLANEPDETLRLTSVSQGADGTVVNNGNGTATYTPTSGFTGTDSFTYTVGDPVHNVATGTVTVAVGTSNPVVLNASAATAENAAVTVAVLNSAFDPNGATLTVSGVTPGANGSVVINANGTVTYTPRSGFTGTDTLTDTVTDGHGNTASSTVTIAVAPAAPLALAATASTTLNTGVTVGVVGFASASPGDTLTVASVTQGADGSVVLNSDGTVTYTPTTGFTGTDSFTYTVTDALGQKSTGTVSVSVASTDPVTAQSTTAWAAVNTPMTFAVLNLATDATGATLTVSGVTQGSDGSVVLNSNGTVTYTPNSGFSGTDSFTYTVKDAQGNSATGTIAVTFGPTAPVVVGTTATTSAGTAVNIAVLSLASDPNGDALSVASVTQGADGSVAINGNGTVTYTPKSGFTGTDTFTYTVSDPYGHQTVGTASVTVGAPVPVALSADASTATGTAVNVAVLTFASDPGTLTVSSVTQGADGSVAINGNGTVTYTPQAGFSGTDTFTYTVKDAGGATATGTITALVGGAAPSAANVQQTENLLLALTTGLSDPNNLSSAIAAQDAAAVANIDSYLPGIIPLINAGLTYGNLAVQAAAYTANATQYSVMSGVNSLLVGVLVA